MNRKNFPDSCHRRAGENKSGCFKPLAFAPDGAVRQLDFCCQPCHER
jgi:hypothetical protein